MHIFKNLYIFFVLLTSIIFFFSTAKVQAKSFEISNIEVSKPFEKNFSKNEVLDIGFRKGFFELINSILRSEDIKKIDRIRLNEIKSMIESFSIKEEKFIKEVYYVILGVTFAKKRFLIILKERIFFHLK